MEIIRDSDVVSGFRFEHPIADFPLLTHCGEAACNANHFIGPHRHSVFEFMYFLRGHLSIQIERCGTFQMAATDLFVAWPGEIHGWANRKHGGFHQFWFGIDLEKLSPEGRELAGALRKSNTHLLRTCSEAEPLMRSLVRQAVRERPLQRKVVEAQLMALVAIIHQRLLIGDAQSPGVFPYALEKARCFMTSHLDGRLPLCDVAAISGYAPGVFCRLFKRATGVSPGAWHLQVRLEAARDALLGIETSIAEVAQQYGFSSSQHFSQAFRRAFHESPGRWRVSADRLQRSESEFGSGKDGNSASIHNAVAGSRPRRNGKSATPSTASGLRRRG